MGTSARLPVGLEHKWIPLKQQNTEGSRWEMLSLEDALASLERTTELPSVENWICIFQKCRKEKNLVNAKRLHVLICDKGLGAHQTVGNHLVSMFVECGSLPDAQQVFDRLVYQNEYSWTSLIRGYTECDKSQHALNLFQKMLEDCVHPSKHTYVALLKACSRLKYVEKGRAIHAEIAKEGFENDLFVGNTLLDMYCKCGSLIEAMQVFDELPVRDVVSWNSLMAGYAHHMLGEEVLNFFQQMLVEGMSPDAVTFVCSLKACSSLGVVDRGQAIHTEIAKTRFKINSFVGSSLVDMYTKGGFLADARQVFDELLIRDVVSWTALITGYVEHGCCEEALNSLEQMKLEGMPPNGFTYASSLKACGSMRAIDKCHELYTEITEQTLEIDTFVSSTLVDVYAKCGSFAEAQKVLDMLSVRNMVSWTSLISGYVECGCDEEALEALDQMQLEAVSPNAFTVACSLKACGNLGAIDRGREIYAEIAKQGYTEAQFVGNALVNMYAKCGSLIEAQEVLGKLPFQDEISWTALIAGYAEYGLHKEVLKCLKQMQLEAVSVDSVTFVSSLKACGSRGTIDSARGIHAEIAKQGVDRENFVCNTLVDIYAKCGVLAEACDLFKKLPERNVIAWTAFIAGYVDHGLGEDALEYFQQMQLEGVVPNDVTFVCILKACGSTVAIDKGREIHTKIAIEEYERSPFVGSTLVDMYAKCGFLAEAQEVANKLPVRDQVSWSALIAGYAERQHCEETLNCLKWMQLEVLSLDDVLVGCILKACGSIKHINKAQEMYAEVAKQGFEKDFFVVGNLVDMYLKCGSLADAKEVFDSQPFRDVVLWNTLISGYTGCGLIEEALDCFQQMQLECIVPDAVTLASCLKVCGTIGARKKGREIHSEIVKQGFEMVGFVCNSLMDMYAKCGCLSEAQNVLQKLAFRDVVSWTALMTGFVEYEDNEEALDCFEQMQLEGMSPNSVTLVGSLKACGNIGAIEQGREIHVEISKQGFEKDHFVGSTMVNMYAKCGLIEEAYTVFDKLPAQSVVSWTALIAGYAEHGLGEEALKCFQQMQLEGLFPNAVTFACSLKACGNIRAIDKGKEVHAEIIKLGYKLDSGLGSCLVHMYAKCGSIAEAQEVLDKLPVKDVASWTALIAGFFDFGLGEVVLRCLEEMQVAGVSPDLVLWNTMMYSYAEEGEIEMTFRLYSQMQEQGLSPNRMTFMSTLKACGYAVALESGRKMHSQIFTANAPEDTEVILATALIDMYCKCGSMVEAQEVFDRIYVRDSMTWNALITGYARQGESKIVFYLLEVMEEEGMNPDEITLLSVLTACSYAGHLDKGQKYFEVMTKEYGITPSIKHHSCMVDLFGRAGQLDQAEVFLEKMPFQPDLASWSSVLGACRNWANVELGRRIFEQAAKLDEDYSAAYLLMCNIYAGAKM